MSRKRSITSDISINPELAEVAEENPQAALMWPWFCTSVDDWCRMEADPRKVKLTVFPSFPFKSSEIQGAMEMLAAAGLAHVYQVNGRQYLMVNPEAFYRLNTYIPNWKQVIDASPMPPPPDHAWGRFWKVRDTESKVDDLRKKYADELRPSTTVVDELRPSKTDAPTPTPTPTPTPSPTPSPTPNQEALPPSLAPSPGAVDNSESEDEEVTDSERFRIRLRSLLASELRVDLGRGESELFAEDLRQAGIDFAAIIYAVDLTKKRASDQPLRYLAAIFDSWMKAGIRTLSQAKAADQRYRAGPQRVRTG
jgi:hypothetical protein